MDTNHTVFPATIRPIPSKAVEDDHEDTDTLPQLQEDEVWVSTKSLRGLADRIAEFECE
jgi:hypothetical protein